MTKIKENMPKKKLPSKKEIRRNLKVTEIPDSERLSVLKSLLEEESVFEDQSVLKEADDLVTVERQKQYGSPFENFSVIAKFWSPILGVEVTPEQVALCMVQVKISREIFKPKRDNRVDMAGYTKTLDMVVDERKKRG